jgi:hypothetical protein
MMMPTCGDSMRLGTKPIVSMIARRSRAFSDDFAALTASGGPVSKASLMVDPPGRARSVTFSDQEVRVFADTAVSRGRLRLEFEDRFLDQWFLRVFAKRDGRWQAVSVAVTPYVDQP